jgi:two-component system sensor histidine kinase QseC
MNETLEFARQVRTGLERVAGIVRRVLSFASPAGRPQTSLELAEVLSETLDFVRQNPAFRTIDFRLSLPQERLPVYGEKTALGQLFLNLVLNACQIQDGRGEVRIEAEARAGAAVVSVLDRGPGIAPEARAQMFEPFFSTRGSSGLGLMVCYQIAVQHGGTIAADNRPDGGACLRVELPLEPAGAAAHAAPVLPGVEA